jgi:hypothetical protein
MIPSREELEEKLMLILQENSSCSFSGNTIIRSEMFYNIVERICEELDVKYEWEIDEELDEELDEEFEEDIDEN